MHKLISRCLAIFTLSLMAFAPLQAKENPATYSIVGPATLKMGNSNSYTLSPAYGPGEWIIQWSCEPLGAIESGDTLTINSLNAPCTFNNTVTITRQNENGVVLASIQVTVYNQLLPGFITTAAQVIPYNSRPATIFASSALDGNCGGAYQYMWQFSEDNTEFLFLEGATTDSLPFYVGLNDTAYYRRAVICGTDTAYTNSVKISVQPAFNAGVLSSGNQSIPLGGTPAQITGTAASSCSGTITYQWQLSTNGLNFSNISGQNGVSLSFSSGRTQTGYFRRKANCGNVTAYTNVVAVVVIDAESISVPLPAGADSVLLDMGFSIENEFNIPHDTIANNRRPSNNIYNTDSIYAIRQKLLYMSSAAWDSLGWESIDTTIVSDTLLASILTTHSQGGAGSDSAEVFYPYIDDYLISSFITANNLNGLDSLAQVGTTVSIEDVITKLEEIVNQDTTLTARIIPVPEVALSSLQKTGVINGPSLATRNQTAYYSVSTHIPLTDSADVRWVVNGGTITSQNTNPSAGPVYANVSWQSSFGSPYIAMVDLQSRQVAILEVTFSRPVCRVYPPTQTVSYGQAPAILMGTTCPSTEQGSSYTYQWQYRDIYAGGSWTDISGATNETYQPPVLEAGFRMYRRVTNTMDEFNVILDTRYSATSTVRLRPINPGTISAASTHIQHNTVPTITATIPSGSFYTAPGAVFTYQWQTSDDGISWTTIGTGINYPSHAIQSSNTRIRRVVSLTGLTVLGPVFYWSASSNVLTFTTFYQSVDFENRTYVRENLALTRGMTTWESVDQLSVENKLQKTTYLDGLGRSIQVVGKGTTYDEDNNQWYDMVQSMVYEAGGRTDKLPLPYPSTSAPGKFKANATTEQTAFFSTNFGDNNAFARLEYESDPMNMVAKTYAPGNAWTGSNVKVEGSTEPYYDSEGVRRWTIGYAPGDVPEDAGVYPSLFLLKQISTDEKGKKKVSYTNRAGQTVLTKVQLADNPTGTHQGWICTYYVYDDLGQERFIITPKAVEALETASWAFDQTIAEELCYRYEYDDRGRVSLKQSSGKAAEYLVYDERSRLVFSQDGNLRAHNEWMTTLYDALDRPVITGITTMQSTQEDLQDLVSSLTGSNAADDVIDGVLVSMYPVPTGADLVKLSYTYYDEYNYNGAKTFVSNLELAYKNGNVEAYVKSKRTLGMPTGTKVMVLNGNGRHRISTEYLITTVFYDEMGRGIQSQSDNIKQGVDLVASQFHFDGRLLSTLEVSSYPNTSYASFPILTKYSFTKRGQLKAISKKINDNARSYSSSTSVSGTLEDAGTGYKKIVSYKYNSLGRRTQKMLSPDYSSEPLETIDYTYNMRGWLTGINKDYALGQYNTDATDHFFGIYLGYDNTDATFSQSRHNGQITGVLWKSQGDNTPRKLDYTYDNANRLIAETFKQRGNENESWNNTKVDFSTTGITYDLNGNLLTLNRKGIVPGASAPLTIDALTYSYRTKTNKLKRVDEGSSNAGNGNLNDFMDGSNGTNGTDDYNYDANGNLSMDRNKGLEFLEFPAFEYNYMNKAYRINHLSKGQVDYIFDAAGTKLQKIFTTYTVSKTVTTTFIGSLVFESVSGYQIPSTEGLQSISHEEGRIRVVTPYNDANGNEVGGGISLPDSKEGVFDYFITDHLQNVRMVITEEVNKASAVCTMEETDSQVKAREEVQFSSSASNNEVGNTRDDRPANWTSGTPPPLTLNDNLSVSKLRSLNGQAHVGPNVFLRVMAGDVIRSRVDYYYVNDPSTTGNSGGLAPMANSLVAALLGGKATELVKDNAVGIGNNLQNTQKLEDFFDDQPTYGNTAAPRAYLNYIFFDEQFNFVGQSSGFRRVSVSGDGAPALVSPTLSAPKNGYVYVYLSNESNEDVFFDNFAVSHERGRILKEDHYYSFGLRIAGISSQSVTSTLSPHTITHGYQGAFSDELLEMDLNYNEFMLRDYDPQIGRWNGIDPYDEFPSPYTGMGNDPVNLVDPTGGFVGGGAFAGMSTAGRMAFGAVAGGLAGFGMDIALGGDGWRGALIGSAAGIGMMSLPGSGTLGTVSTVASASTGIGTMNSTANVALSSLSFIRQAVVPEFYSGASLDETQGLGWKGGFNNRTLTWDDIVYDGKTYKAVSTAEFEAILTPLDGSVGLRYERLVIKFGLGYSKNKTPIPSGYVPDAIVPNRLATLNLRRGIKVKDVGNDIIDSKLSPGLGGDKQMIAFLNYVMQTEGGKQGIGSVWLVGAADSRVTQYLHDEAAKRNVNLFQTTAYRDPDDPTRYHVAQWVGVTHTRGSIMFNRMHGPSSSSKAFIGSFYIPPKR